MREALEEERGRSEASIQRAVERAQEQVRTKMEDMAKVSKIGRSSIKQFPTSSIGTFN